MIVDNLLSAIHAVVTNLDDIAIEDFFREVFFYKHKESVSDIGADLFTECRVVPECIVPLFYFPFVSR